MKARRAGALIINNKRIVLVSNDEIGLYWTPGGRLNDNEDYDNALRREILEELGVEIKEAKLFSQVSHDYTPVAKYFLVEVSGDPKPATEEVTKVGWFTKEQIESGEIKVTPNFTKEIFPQLIKAGLL
jgi:ADP-ribose pyrophosphatase YjhB (NUDIX family)